MNDSLVVFVRNGESEKWNNRSKDSAVVSKEKGDLLWFSSRSLTVELI